MLTHEYVHAVVRPLAPMGVPAWIHEGLAALLEPDGRRRAEEDVRTAGVLIPVAQLQESFATLPAPLVTLAYAQSALGVAAMADRAGMPAVLGLMRDLAAGDSLARAFEARIRLPLEELERGWVASMKRRGPAD
jgi:hypothetical protein